MKKTIDVLNDLRSEYLNEFVNLFIELHNIYLSDATIKLLHTDKISEDFKKIHQLQERIDALDSAIGVILNGEISILERENDE